MSQLETQLGCIVCEGKWLCSALHALKISVEQEVSMPCQSSLPL